MLIVFLSSIACNAGQPNYTQLPINKPFLFNFDIGYGISNQPLVNAQNGDMVGGVVIAGSFGYRFSRKFTLTFGPTFWLEGNDVLSNKAANNNRPSNKRVLISFNGFYKPSRTIPVQIKLGAGIGNVVYTPTQQVVLADGNGTSNTAFFNGFAGCIGLLSEIKLTDKFKIHPSLNFTYSDIREQNIDYTSNINPNKPSLTADLRLNFMFAF